MVFRSEGAAALREYLQGARVPADVYLLRKMQSEDPNTGPVTRAVRGAAVDRQVAPADPPSKAPVFSSAPSRAVQVQENARQEAKSLSRQIPATEPFDSREKENARSRVKSRNGVESFLAFVEPLPPLARSVEDVPALYAWLLEKDPVIPNNLARLQAIHADVFRNKPAARLGYEQHLLLQIVDDLSLYTTEDALGFHLSQLAMAYRRAADVYRKAEHEGAPAMNLALWQMASMASRMRLEAWVYHARHGEPPQLPSSRQRELPLKFPGN
jgi:hypothetical protein